MGRVTGRTRTGVIALIVVLLVMAAGCGGGGGTEDPVATATTVQSNALVDEGAPVEGGTLTIAVGAETDGWNPGTNQWANEGNLVGSSFLEPLMTFNSEGVAIPWLAESVVANGDNTLFSIKLREGIKFHDGTEMDAAAVANSLAFQKSPTALVSIVIAELIAEPVVTGKYTLDIPMKAPWGAFPSQLAGNYGYVMAPSMLLKDDNGSSSPVGTGAYKFDKAEKDRFVKVSRFDDYWGGPCAITNPTPDVVALCEEVGVPLGQRNGPFLTSMEFRPIPDSLQRSQSLESGDVDLIQTTRALDVANLRNEYQVVTDYDSEQTFVMLSTDKPPFNNLHARRALAYATDRQALGAIVGGGEELGFDSSPFEESSKWGGLAPDQTGYPTFDPEKVAEEIELYKADTQATDLSFNLTGLATVDNLQVMQALAEQWSSLGINASLDSVKQEALIPILIGGKAQAVLYGNYASPDPDQNFVFWSETFKNPPIIINFSQWANETTETALQLGRASSDVEYRKQFYAELVKVRNDNVIDVWLYNTPWAWIAASDVRGLNPFRTIGLAAITSKPWVQALWVAPSQPE